MATSSPTLVPFRCMLNETYTTGDKWRIDTIAFGPSNELAISGHNIELPKTFVFVYSHKFATDPNSLKFNRCFDNRNCGRQLVTFLGNKWKIVKKGDEQLEVFDIRRKKIYQTVKWKQNPMCVSVFGGKLFYTAKDSTIVTVLTLDLKYKNEISLNDIKNDYPSDIVVLTTNIYICTKVIGQAIAFTMGGRKEKEFQNTIDKNAKANSMCVNEKSELVFVLWNRLYLQLYSQTSSQCLKTFQFLGANIIRITTDNLLVTASTSPYSVNVYDMSEEIINSLKEEKNELENQMAKREAEASKSEEIINSLEEEKKKFESQMAKREAESSKSKVNKFDKMENLPKPKRIWRRLSKHGKRPEKFSRFESRHMNGGKTSEEIINFLEEEKMKLEIQLANREEAASKCEEMITSLEEEKRKLESHMEKRVVEANKSTEMIKFLVEDKMKFHSHMSDRDEAGMLTRFLSDSEQERSFSKMDELESVISASEDSGICNTTASSRDMNFENTYVATGEQLNPDLKVAVTVTRKGAKMHIPDTGVELNIPSGAWMVKRLIEMTIISFDKLNAPVSTFSSNSSVAVELLPNRARFVLPVCLTLPHCLQLKKNYKETENAVKVYVSHHEAGLPVWEEDTSAKSILNENHCIIFLKQFCWVKYEINNKLVEAKRLKVFTAGHRLNLDDSVAEIHVGYHIDLPGRQENSSVIPKTGVYQSKPFIFVKEGKVPMQLTLTKTVPMQWTYITPDENPKIISYKSIADDKDTSCSFVLEKDEPTHRKPFAMFTVSQGEESVELNMRF